jgi:hypothetical protein
LFAVRARDSEAPEANHFIAQRQNRQSTHIVAASPRRNLIMAAFLCADLIEYPVRFIALLLAILKAVPDSLLARKGGFFVAI